MSHSAMSMDMGGSSDGDAACKISMLWNWYTIDACFISSSWHVRNGGMFAASCIGVALLAILLEALRRIGKEYDALVYRQFHTRAKALETKARAQHLAPGEGGKCACAQVDEAGSQSFLEAARAEQRRPVELSGLFTFRASPLQQVIRAFIHAVTFAVAYILMLIGMYYNGFMLISIFLGIGIGKFLTDWLVVKIFIDGNASTAAAGSSAARNKDVKSGSGADPAADDRNPTVCCG